MLSTCATERAPVFAPTLQVFAEALQPCIKEGKEADVAELTAALTSARKMVQWALDKDRSMVSVDELVSRVRAHRDPHRHSDVTTRGRDTTTEV